MNTQKSDDGGSLTSSDALVIADAYHIGGKKYESNPKIRNAIDRNIKGRTASVNEQRNNILTA